MLSDVSQKLKLWQYGRYQLIADCTETQHN